MAINKPKPVAAAGTGGVGLAPENFVEGGGLYDDFDGTILDIAAIKWNYDDDTKDWACFLSVEIRNDEADPADSQADAEGKTKNPFVQNYRAADLDKFVPSEDGNEFIPVGSKTGLHKSSTAFAFINSMVQAGFEASRIGKSLAVFKGARFHFKRESDVQFGERTKGRSDQTKGRAQLLAEKLISYGGEAAAPAPGPKAAGPKPAPAPKPAAAGPKPAPAPAPNAAPAAANPAFDETVTMYAQLYVTEKLEAAGGTVPKQGLAVDVVKWAKEQGLDNPTRNKVIQALGSDAFLGQDGLGWVFDGSTLTQS